MGTGWTEDSVHRWLAEAPAPGALAGGAMHDAAVLHRLAGAPVLCTDQCVAGVHAAEDVDARRFGAKAVLRTASDLAAAAARPVAFTLALRAPREEPEDRIRGVIEGARAAARDLDAWLVAGDLASGPGPMGASVTALGSYGGEGPPPSRHRATAGQIVLVSGPLGGSLRSGRHLRIRPRIDAGVAAARAGAAALMDVSDGLAWDLFRLARTAGVAIELDLEAVPVHTDAVADAEADPARSALERALHDGEDHELIATIDPDALRARGPLEGWTAVGRVTPGEGLRLRDAAGERTDWSPGAGGWRHGDGGAR